jgi:hypothetical protein
MKKPRTIPQEQPMRVVSVACGVFVSPTDLPVAGLATNGARIVDGFAITDGIPADVWDTWQAANIDTDIVRNALIYAIEAPAVETAPEAEAPAPESEPEPEPILVEAEAPAEPLAEPEPEPAAEPAPEPHNEEPPA